MRCWVKGIRNKVYGIRNMVEGRGSKNKLFDNRQNKPLNILLALSVKTRLENYGQNK